MDRKQQGNIGEAFSIYHYTSRGFIVSKPLTENTPYDLIVDNHDRLFKVQVKTSSYQRYEGGGFTVQLRTNGGNMSGAGKYKLINPSEVDVVFVLCSNGCFYEIPSSIVEGKANIIVSETSEFFLGKTTI